MACTLIGGTTAGTVLTLLFLPALYAMWFRVRKPAVHALAVRSLAAAH
jgi:Cu/Ag efflux pump CusA